MVNYSERKIKSMLEAKGYEVLHKGAPDFLCYRMNPLHPDRDKYLFVEVKSGNANPTKEQIYWFGVLKHLGANVFIVNADESDDIVSLLKKA